MQQQVLGVSATQHPRIFSKYKTRRCSAQHAITNQKEQKQAAENTHKRAAHTQAGKQTYLDSHDLVDVPLLCIGCAFGHFFQYDFGTFYFCSTHVQLSRVFVQ